MIRLLLVDDQEIFRQGLATMLSVEADLEIAGQAANGEEAIEAAKRLQPHVILMDVQMPICNGIQATQAIHECYPWIRILVLTTFDDDEYILQSLQVGALGYLLKRTPAPEIAAAIRSVAQGYSQLGPTIAAKAFSQLKAPTNDIEPNSLSKREIDVLKLVAEGMNNAEIAEELYLSEGTVRNHVTQILSKLELRDRIAAVLWAQRHLF
jgi:DNA-binding NarL/FixJ family response regulator